MKKIRISPQGWRWISVVASVGVLLCIALFDQNVRGLGAVLRSIQLTGILLALGCIVLFWLADAGILYLGCLPLPGKINPVRAFVLSIVGQYYSALTPFSSGGQPFQVAFMRRWNIPSGASAGMFVVKFVMWQLAISTWSCIGIFRYWELIRGNPALLTAIMVGTLFNTGATLVGLLALSRLNVERPVRALYHLLARVRIIKDEAGVLERFHQSMDDFAEGTALLRSHPVTALGMFALTIVQMFALYAVAWCMVEVLGVPSVTFWMVMTLQGVLNAAVAFVPSPGATGATEGVFYLLYSAIFPQSVLFTAMLLWRFFTYYLQLIVGTIVLFVDGLVHKREPEQL